MKAQKITLAYLVTYLAIGGLGFTLFPNQVLQLFLSNGDYGDIMPRMVGMFMCALSFLIFGEPSLGLGPPSLTTSVAFIGQA